LTIFAFVGIVVSLIVCSWARGMKLMKAQMAIALYVQGGLLITCCSLITPMLFFSSIFVPLLIRVNLRRWILLLFGGLLNNLINFIG